MELNIKIRNDGKEVSKQSVTIDDSKIDFDKMLNFILQSSQKTNEKA